MSHFSVAVLHEAGQDIDEILAPYDEELDCDERLEYSKEEAIRYARENYTGMEGKSDEECWEFMAAMPGYTSDTQGNIYVKYNELAKWDWYEIGGRWKNYLRAKGERVDSARLGDIDFSPDCEVYKKSLRFWDVVVEHKPVESGEEYFTIYNEKYYRDNYGDRENYARVSSSFLTHAVITPDGEWHERGEVGYFGFSSETAEEGADWDKHYLERFIESADKNLMLTIVDCHI